LSIITNADVKSFLNISVTDDDTLIDDIITRIEAYIQNVYCQRKFEAQDLTEYYDGDGTDTLLLDNYPIVSITSIHDDPDREYNSDDLIDSDDIIIYPGKGIIVLDGTTFDKSKKNIKVVYRAGYGDGEDEIAMPNDLKMAFIKLAASEYLKSKAKINVIEGEDEQTVDKPGRLSKEAYEIFDKYRRIR